MIIPFVILVFLFSYFPLHGWIMHSTITNRRFQLMRHITFPALLPTYFVMLMLSVANFLNNGMDQYFVFQNSFNKAHIQVLDLYVYNIGMTGSSLSLATAISMLKSVVSVVLLFVVNFVSKKTRGESII